MPLPLRRIALRLSRLSIGGGVVAAVARWLPGLLPSRVAVLPHLVLLRHPVPMARVHLLAIPRRQIRDVMSCDLHVGAFWSDLEDWAVTKGAEEGVVAGITNVGTRQDVRLLHVHLVADAPAWCTPRWSGRTLPEAMARVCEELHDQDDLSGSFGFSMIAGKHIEVSFDRA